MADNINDLELFVHIVAAGSLSKAALVLDSSPPAVSRRLAAMEARLGVRLIDRHARRFQLTEAGAGMYERAQRILAEIEDAEAEATSHSQQLTGRLRLGAMLQLGRSRLAPEVARFSQQYPGLRIELVLSDDPLDLAEDELDILFQFNVPQTPDIIARKLASTRLVMCAAPEYLRKRGRPQQPDDLLSHDCICLTRGRHVIRQWTVQEDGVSRDIHVKPTLVCNSSEAVYSWIRDGYGIGLQLEWDVEKDLTAGRLEICLPEFRHVSLPLYAVYAYRGGYPSPKTKAFLDYMSGQMTSQQDNAAVSSR